MELPNGLEDCIPEGWEWTGEVRMPTAEDHIPYYSGEKWVSVSGRKGYSSPIIREKPKPPKPRRWIVEECPLGWTAMITGAPPSVPVYVRIVEELKD